ncbi:MAG: hypothetical protein M3Z06_01060 [Actinomycetota bacterium]|nr:hypothetical protein [Actinomycetota bacterium]
MNRTRAAAAAILTSRVAYGVGLAVAPERLAAGWLGASASSKAGQVPLRALGAREAAFHGAALIALARDEPVRRWLVASIAGDLTDVVSTIAARREVPGKAPVLTVALGGGAAALSAVLARALER